LHSCVLARLFCDFVLGNCLLRSRFSKTGDMSEPSLLAALRERPLCCDGAMGTELMARGLRSGESAMLWNVERRSEVESVHAAYKKAGCDLFTTNSFGGAATMLALHGLAHRAAELNHAAARLARNAAGETGFVLGDIGPFGGFLEPAGETSEEEAIEIFRAQIEALLTGGADAILAETLSDPAEAAACIRETRSLAATVPVFVTYAFQKTGPGEFRTMMGISLAEAIERTVAAGAGAVGANCGLDLDLEDYMRLAREICAISGSTPVIIQPNAGSPEMQNGVAIYHATPGQMAETARQLLDTGVKIIGGCCGTTPEHMKAVSGAVHGI
jgi:methionine synthase I (cobalamin-dependent)